MLFKLEKVLLTKTLFSSFITSIVQETVEQLCRRDYKLNFRLSFLKEIYKPVLSFSDYTKFIKKKEVSPMTVNIKVNYNKTFKNTGKELEIYGR